MISDDNDSVNTSDRSCCEDPALQGMHIKTSNDQLANASVADLRDIRLARHCIAFRGDDSNNSDGNAVGNAIGNISLEQVRRNSALLIFNVFTTCIVMILSISKFILVNIADHSTFE